MKLLLYCTKAKPYLVKRNIFAGVEPSYFTLKENVNDLLNGKVVAECDFEVEEIYQEFENKIHRNGLFWYQTNNLTEEELLKHSGLTVEEFCEYLKPLEQKYIYGKGWQIKPNGYAIHIMNLHIFDEPRELSECYKKYGGINYSPIYYMPITNAPQNMMRVWLYENGEWVMYILISIQPQWLCKILNGEKTIEVRKKVLKEML